MRAGRSTRARYEMAGAEFDLGSAARSATVSSNEPEWVLRTRSRGLALALGR